MEESFDYRDIPKGYAHCLHSSCRQSSDCLRFRVALSAGAGIRTFLTVNPAYADSQEGCPYFDPDRMTHFALGMQHLFDNVPHKKAVRIRDILYNRFGKTQFYRMVNKERPIDPEKQAIIREVFIKEGIDEEPVFDTYIDQYNWTLL